MRRGKVIFGVVVAAGIGLSACGIKATIQQAVSSVGASPYLQVHLTGSVSGTGTQKAQQILGSLSLDMQYQSVTGAALSSSSGHVNSRIVVNVGSQTLAEVRVVGSNLYVSFNVTAFSSVPTVHVSQQQLAQAQLLLGGRWFELPASALHQLEAKGQATTTPSQKATQKATQKAAVQQILDSVTSVIDETQYTETANGGYKQTGSLQSIVAAALPGFEQLTGKVFHPTSVKGSYTVGLSMSGMTATGGSIQISAPNSGGQGESVSLDATVSHNSVSVTAPSNATVITPALLQQLEGQLVTHSATAA